MQVFANSILVLQPGLYILRHPGMSLAPLSVARAHSAAPVSGRIELMGTPGTHASVLRNGTDCIVVQVLDAPVSLLISAFLDRQGAPVPQLRCDRISLDAAPAPAPSAATAPPAPPRSAPPAALGAPAPIAISPNGISLIGHLERIGDTVAAEGEELGKPAEQLRIEGLQIMWPDRPDGVDLVYAIGVEGMGRSAVVGTGTFCGTRGQARRITELTVGLSGAQAAAFRLEGSAVFSGGFRIPVVDGLPLGGPSGMEHLTGLSLRALPLPIEHGKERLNPWAESAHTQVFRAAPAAAP